MNKRIIHTVFEDVAAGLSSKVAIEAGSDHITYGALNTLANRLSHLLTYLNYGPEKIVNVVMPPSIHLVGTMLGIFKSGSIFLPVDPGFSEKRLRQVFRDTFDGAVIVTADLKEKMLEIAAVLDISIAHLIVVNADDSLLLYTGTEDGLMPELFDEEDIWSCNPPLVINGDSAAYIYYTSGSTGDGKAILGAHASLSHFIQWEIREFGFNNSGRFSQLAQITFDASLRDIFVALISGGTLCIPPANVKTNPAQLLGWLAASGVSTVHCVPSLFRVLTKELETAAENTYNLRELTHVLMAGELIFAKDIHNWRRVAGNNACLVNLYGPTETTLIKTFYRIQEVPANPSQAIPAGIPISNTVVAIIQNGRICRPGEKGEIYIKTPFATKGYYRNEQLTSECFVQNPLVSDERDIVYKTGDLGRYLPDGNIEVLGRMDTQVKVNGIRVELTEIERALLDLTQVTGAVVKLHSTAEHFSTLVAYYTGTEMDAEQLRKELEKTLNPQLIPSCFIYMQAFPLNMNGKVDRKSLPLPEEVIMGGTAFEPPVGEMENALAAFWKEILGYKKTGRNISFFNAGGNSLRAIQLISRIEKAFGVSLSIADIFTYPTIAEMAAFITNGTEMEFSDIPVVAEQPHYALSASQRRLWMLSQLGETSVAYNMSGIYTFEGELSAAALNHAFNKLVQRHESLRTVFSEDDAEGVRQFILTAEKAGARMVVKDVRQEGELLPCLLYQVTGRPFDLTAGPLVRAALYRVADDKWIFAYGMHHIISDGWSMNVLINELLTFYKAHTANIAYPLPPLRIQYKDYAAWQLEQLSGELREKHRAYWLLQFAGELPVLELITDRPRPVAKTYNGGVVHKRMGNVLTRELQELMQQESATLFMGLLAAVNALLYRYTGQEDIIIGSPVAGRGHIDLENQIGFYVNTLALRARFNGKDSYRELLSHIRNVTLGAYEHQVYPFDELVNDLDVPRDMSRSALFDVMIVLQDARTGKGNEQFLDNVRVSEYHGDERHTSKFDLNFRFSETSDGLHLNIVYNSDLYDGATVARMADHLEQLLRTAVADAGCPVQELDYIGVEEEHQLLEVFNNMDAAPVSDKTFVTLFEEQAALYPDRKAVVCDEESLTYRELNERANRLACYLRNEQSIDADGLVGILLDRSADMIVGILGVLKSGGAYVPIDPEYPQQRISFLLEDTAVEVLLTNSEYRSLATGYNGTLFEMDRQLDELPHVADNPAFAIAGDDLAYVIYTSGSTGQPKGVMISHGSLSDYCLGVLSRTNISECRHFGLLSTIAADLGNTVLYPALLVGGTLHIFPGTSQLDAERMRRAALDCIKIVPSHWKALSDEAGCFVPARCLIFGGESLTADVLSQIRSVNSTCRVYNHYGPTETTVGKLIHEVMPEGRIPLGAPFCRSEVYILDKQDQLCGIGIPGEICISGAGVARGYLNRPELTAEKFVVNPYRENERMYRTGDVGRWLPDGRIEYLGRKDDQVKLRGYRIELGEIARSLESHALIRSAVAVVRTSDTGEQELAAYFSGDAGLQVSELRSWLSRSLPSYMLPHHYVQLDAIPLTANGKVDRRKLPEPDGLAIDARVAYVAPRNETEEKLIQIWETILGKQQIGVKDNFFELGGHSLKATRLVTHIHKVFEVRLPLRALFANEVLEEQAQLIQEGKKTSFISIAPVEERAFYPLSATQRRLWMLGQFDEDNVAFNMQRVYVFEGKLDMASLQASFDTLIARHESLRTVFREDEQGEVGQVILQQEQVRFSIDYKDISDEKEQEARLRELIAAAASCPFNLASGPLVRATVYQVAANKWVFYYGMHHIVSDGWSMSVLLKELLLSYNAAVNGTVVTPAPLRIQYKDYAVWQQEQLGGTALQTHREYWLERFEGELPVLILPADRSRPPVKTYNGSAIYKVIGRELTGRLKQLLQQEGSTLFMGLLAAVKALLHRYSQQEDIVVGSPVAGRDHIELENQIGFYINPLALRTQLRPADSYLQLLRKVKQVTLDAYEHQMYPFDELVDELNPPRDMSRSPLFDVMVILQNHDSVSFRQQQDLTDLRVSEYKGEEHEVSKFDLSFYFVENNGEIRAKIEYNSDLFDSATVSRIAGHLEQVLDTVTAQPDIAVGRIDYLTMAEQQLLLTGFNDTDVTFPEDTTFITLFEEQVRQTPDNAAIIFGDVTLSYSELNERANQLADYLRTNYDVQADDLIGIKLDRSEWMLVAILGVMKAGAGYIPLDVNYPQERVDYILSDSNSKVLVDEQELERFRTTADLYTSVNPPITAGVNNLAYVIYTSGSTGRPKGAMIEHAGMLNHLVAMAEELELDADSRIAQIASFTFDISVWQLLNALITGGITVMYSQQEILDPAAFLKSMEKQRITILQVVPSYLKVLLDIIDEGNAGDLSRLSYMLVTGEAVTRPVLSRWFDAFPDKKVVNAYGPAEAADDITLHIMDRVPDSDNIPVGKPIRNIRIYILDNAGMLCGIGAEGEICVSGIGVGRAYLNDPERTARSFTIDPFRPGEQVRMYRTGDLGRWLPDGTLEFIGRRDNQVKVRGYRIELGEIESALLRYPEMEAVVVNAFEEANKEKVLVAYLVNKQSLNADTLRSYLGDKLPPYMIPSCFMQLDELPLNANGKVDRKRLPAPGKDSLSTGVTYVAPQNETEETLVNIWQDILGKEQIGIKDNFFEAGGHSLKVTRLSSQIHKRFDVKIALKDLFTKPVLEEQAMLIRQVQRTSFTAIPVAPEQPYYELSSSQRRLWVLSQFENGNVAYNMPGAFIFEGELDSYAFTASFEWLIARHEILRTVFREDEKGNVRQFILSPGQMPFHIDTIDLRKRGRKINELIQRDFTQHFDLAAGPLLRASLYRIADNKWVFTYVMHHIISDGWSMNVLMKELLMLYNASTGRQENPLLPLRIQYKDYATWQQQQGEELLREHKEYWLKQFSGWLPVLELPADKPRPAIQTYNGGLVQRKISASASTGLKTLTRQQDSTLFMGLLAAVNVLLYRYTGQDDIIIGSPVAGREHADLEDQIGLYLNTLALRTSFDGNDSYYKLLENVKQVALDAYEHQLYPFDDLVDELKLHRDMSRNALFDVMVTLHNTRTHDTNALRPDGLTIAKYEWSNTPISKFDLSFDFVEAGEEIQVSIEYNSDLFEKETVSRMAVHLELLLQNIITNPSMPLCRFDYVSDEEKRQLLETFNDTTVLYNKDRLVIDLFEEQVEKTPDHMALVFGETELCYHELNERANQLAGYLSANYRLMPNHLAGIKLARSEWMIIATLAVLKTGAAYVPVDPGYPQDRIDYMLADSNCKLVVDEELLRHFMQTAEEYGNTNPVRTTQPDDLVYVIYTSGSTGRPKGVMVANKHVVNIAEGWRRSYGLDNIHVNLLQMASHSFDVFMGDVCRSLLTGGKMVICPNDVKLDPESLYSMMERHRISILESPPGVLLPLMDYILDNNQPLDFMKLLIFGSDTLNITAYKKLVDRVGDQLRIINSYGATEAAIDSSYYEAGPGAVIRAYHSTPIGKPFPNSSFYILNNEDQLQPVGIAGEICIGGAGVAKGYLNREELTAEKFTANPFRAGERMYRTGDLGRWLPDGNVEFLGRKDDQVKIRGYRVELGEIESALLLHPEVEAAVAAVQTGNGGEKDLVAYLVIRNELHVSDIRSYLNRNLPAYMIPNYYVQLEELPLTPNGKIDRKRLPSHKGLGMSASVEYVAPRNETEKQLVQIWEEVLDRKEIGIKDNFFELGGHSLKLMRVLARISEQFDVKISIETFFKDPYIEVLSRYIDAFLTLQEEAIPETTDELIF